MNGIHGLYLTTGTIMTRVAKKAGQHLAKPLRIVGGKNTLLSGRLILKAVDSPYARNAVVVAFEFTIIF